MFPLTQPKTEAWPENISRDEMIRILSQQYSESGKIARKLRVRRKKAAWLLVIGGSSLLKRALDVFISLGMLLILMPIFLLVALAIKLTDGGPVLFRQTRIGLWGCSFRFPKFRSMVMNAEALVENLLAENDHEEAVTFKMKRDPRITWIGRIIRKLSIDELPQLWCVLTGEMSLVGPRPPLPREVAFYSQSDRRRLDVKPGLTCIWQVSGRGDLPFSQQVELDVQYIESRSLMVDIKLLIKTVPAVLLGRGAY